MANTNEMSAEEMEKQRQNQQMMMAQMQKNMKLQQMQQIIMNTDPSTVLKTVSKMNGITLFCQNPMISMQLLNTIYTDLFAGGEVEDDVLKSIADALNRAVSFTNSRRMSIGFGGMGGMQNGMMGGMGMMPGMMGMGMPGMNMGMNMMNPMMGGMGMMNPMMGMGMNMNTNMQQQKTDGSDQMANVKAFIEQNLKPMNPYTAVDPLIFLQLLVSSGIDLDFSSDKNFSALCSQAIICAIYGMNDFQFNTIYSIISYMYYSNIYQQQMDAAKKNGGNANQNPMMNPMMIGGMGMMNPMMGMGMPGMGMMPGMMGGMQNGFDANNQNGMMGMNMMNPMMGGMGMPGMGMMPGMMGGMNMGMNMPGMTTSFGGVQQNTGSIW